MSGWSGNAIKAIHMLRREPAPEAAASTTTQPTPVEVTGEDARLLFTAAQLWATLPYDLYAQCLGTDVVSEEVETLRQSRPRLGTPGHAVLAPVTRALPLRLLQRWIRSTQRRSRRRRHAEPRTGCGVPESLHDASICCTASLREVHTQSLPVSTPGELSLEVQRRVTGSRAWAAQLGMLLDVMLRMGLLGKVLRTQHAADAPTYLISRTAIRREPPQREYDWLHLCPSPLTGSKSR